MKFLKDKYSLIIAIAVFAIVGCGGSESPEVVIPEVVIIEPDPITVTIEGLVTGQALGNDNVLVSVGGQTFSTVTDENGAYSIDISLDGTFDHHIVSVIASSVDASNTVILASLLGSFESLYSLAGSDTILTKDELFRVNVSSVSTALMVLLEKANNELPITNTSMLENASRSIDSSSLLPLAAALQLIVDYSDSNSELALPMGSSNTLDFARNSIAVNTYLTNAQSVVMELYYQVLLDLVANTDLVSAGVNEIIIPVIDTYYFGEPRNNQMTGSRLTLNADGTGMSKGYSHDETFFNWSKTDRGVEIDYGPEGIIESWMFVRVDGYATTVRQEIIRTGQVIKWLSQSNTHDLLAIESNTIIHYPDVDIPDSAPTTKIAVKKVLKTAATIDASEFLEMGVEYNFPITRESTEETSSKGDGMFTTQTGSVYSKKMVFSGSVVNGGNVAISTFQVDGSGIGSFASIDEPWLVNTDGSLIIGQTASVDYVFIASKDANSPLVSLLKDGVDKYDHFGRTDYVLQNKTDWSGESVAGFYYEEPRVLLPLNLQWWEIKADGTAYEVTTSDDNSNGVLEADEVSKSFRMWQINSEGELVIRWYADSHLGSLYTTCTPTAFEPLDSDYCALLVEWIWDLQEKTATEGHYLTKQYTVFSDPWRQSFSDPDATGHLLAWSNYSSELWLKSNEEPLQLPELDKIQNSKEIDVIDNYNQMKLLLETSKR